MTVSLRELKKKLYLCLMSVTRWKRFVSTSALLVPSHLQTRIDGRQRQNYSPDCPRRSPHLTGTQHMLNLLRSGADDPGWRKLPKSVSRSAMTCLFRQSTGERLGGLSVPRRFDDWSDKDILCQYVEYITNIRMQAVVWICRSRRAPTRSRGSTLGWV